MPALAGIGFQESIKIWGEGAEKGILICQKNALHICILNPKNQNVRRLAPALENLSKFEGNALKKGNF